MLFKSTVLRPVFVVILSASLAACAGRQANPTASYRVGDEGMSCPELRADMAHVQAQVNSLVPESDKTGKNVTLGVLGWWLLVPWFFMDFSDTEKVEIKAYQERYLSLEKLYSRKKCGENVADIIGSDSSVELVIDRNAPSARLLVLKDLFENGLISEEEYQKQRQAIIDNI